MTSFIGANFPRHDRFLSFPLFRDGLQHCPLNDQSRTGEKIASRNTKRLLMTHGVRDPFGTGPIQLSQRHVDPHTGSSRRSRCPPVFIGFLNAGKGWKCQSRIGFKVSAEEPTSNVRVRRSRGSFRGSGCVGMFVDLLCSDFC